jgi:hypothetical protein
MMVAAQRFNRYRTWCEANAIITMWVEVKPFYFAAFVKKNCKTAPVRFVWNSPRSDNRIFMKFATGEFF